jgi:hypothetical protein
VQTLYHWKDKTMNITSEVLSVAKTLIIIPIKLKIKIKNPPILNEKLIKL